MTSPYNVSLQDIHAARERIAGHIRRTPFTSSKTISKILGVKTSLKLELFQTTGSFKVRGAFNKLLAKNLQPGTHVVAVSGGNHAQAVAYAAAELGLRSTILMPETTPPNYLQATAHYGAQIVLVADVAQAFEKLRDYEREGAVPIHPFDDPLVLAGQGTTGLEILEDIPDASDVFVSIGGGGFMGGISVALKALKPKVRIWGVETQGADAMSQALLANEVVRLPRITSIAKTLGAPAVSEKTLELAKKYLEEVIVVSDAEAIRAAETILERAKVLTEPAASCTFAAAQQVRDRLPREGHVVLVLCGGNIALADLCRFRSEFASESAQIKTT
jgi:threonine dehydratase